VQRDAHLAARPRRDVRERATILVRVVSASPPAAARLAPELTLLYDGECPLCSREIAMLRRRDRRGRLGFADISAPDFDAGRYGTTREALMARIHAALPDGSLVRDVEVFRRAYAAVGLGWLVAPTRWPLLRPLFDRAYRVFARNRLRWTGRGAECAGGHCAVAEGDERARP
jgi:predicted DCC family thiol-disulfide oxidoreductase YuxK